MIEPTWWLLGLLLPGAISALGVYLGLRLAGSGRGGALIAWTLGLSAAFATGFYFTAGWPTLPPSESHDWLVLVLLPAAAVLALLDASDKVPRPAVWLLRLIIAGGAAPLLMQIYLTHHWTPAQSGAWFAGLGAAIFLVWALLKRYADRHGDHVLALMMLIVVGGMAVVNMASDSQMLGQLGAVLTAALAGGWLATLRFNARAGRGLVDVTMGVFVGLLISGRFYSWQMDQPWAADLLGVLLLAAPLGVWASVLPGFRGDRGPKGFKAVALRLLVVAVPIAVAACIAGYIAYVESTQAGPSYY